MKIRAQKLASLATPFNSVQTSKSATSALNSVTPTTSSTSTSLKWTPTRTDSKQRQADDEARTPTDKHVAGISVLKQDKLDSSASLSSDLRPNKPLSSMISKTDSDRNAIDITDIENSLSDVSRYSRF